MWQILDLDNCVSDDKWRTPFIRWDQSNHVKRFHHYHIRCDADRAANLDEISTGLRTIICTARPDCYFAKTHRWIKRSKINATFIFMRRMDDARPSVDVKRDMVRRILESGIGLEHIVAAYDDHDEIVDMYRDVGIKAAAVLRIHEQSIYAPRGNPNGQR